MKRSKKILLLSVILAAIVLAAPFTLLLGPERLRDYMHKELVYKVIVDKLADGMKSDKEKALKLMDYVYRHVPTNLPGFEVIDKHPLSDLFRGFGVCDQVANTLITLARKAHIKGRLIFLRGHKLSSQHSVCDLYIDGKFRIFDPTFDLVFINNEKEMATFEDIQKNKVEPDPLLLYSKDIASFYRIAHIYFPLFEPAYPPTYFRRNFEQDLKRFFLSRWVDLYYDIFGDPFLILYQEAYLKLSNADPYTKARYKHLASRYDPAVIDYDHVLDTVDNELIKADSIFFKGQLFWDRNKHESANLEFMRLLDEFPNTRRKHAALNYLIDYYEKAGDPDKRQYYLSLQRPAEQQ